MNSIQRCATSLMLVGSLLLLPGAPLAATQSNEVSSPPSSPETALWATVAGLAGAAVGAGIVGLIAYSDSSKAASAAHEAAVIADAQRAAFSFNTAHSLFQRSPFASYDLMDYISLHGRAALEPYERQLESFRELVQKYLKPLATITGRYTADQGERQREARELYMLYSKWDGILAAHQKVVDQLHWSYDEPMEILRHAQQEYDKLQLSKYASPYTITSATAVSFAHTYFMNTPVEGLYGFPVIACTRALTDLLNRAVEGIDRLQNYCNRKCRLPLEALAVARVTAVVSTNDTIKRMLCILNRTVEFKYEMELYRHTERERLQLRQQLEVAEAALQQAQNDKKELELAELRLNRRLMNH